LYEGKILDGRSRVAAVKKAGMTKIINTNFEGFFEQACDFVISMNLKRRHLDAGQRAMAAAELATLQRGSNPQNCGLPAKAAAEQLKNARASDSLFSQRTGDDHDAAHPPLL
jgi:hypothetical protein